MPGRKRKTMSTTAPTSTSSSSAEGGESSLYSAEKKTTSIMGRRRGKKKRAIAASDGKTAVSISGAFLRIERDLAEIELPDTVAISKKTDDLKELRFDIQVDSGLWKGGKYEFKFDFPDKYPIEGPKVTCMDKIYHPNIDLDGHVCTSVLRNGWRAVYTTQIVMFALLFLFTNPNPNDPLNTEAAEEMRERGEQFKRNVTSSMRGQAVKGSQFPRNRGLR
jgi:ubiquitin-conjugating enzyme E2 M